MNNKRKMKKKKKGLGSWLTWYIACLENGRRTLVQTPVPPKLNFKNQKDKYPEHDPFWSVPLMM
jgi:hypothetical protein